MANGRSLINSHFLLLICSFASAKEWMNPTPVELFVPQNLQTGDEIVGERPLKINDDVDEFVAVSLSPTSDAVSIAPAVVEAGKVFRLILKDREALLKDFTIQCLGVYSGNLQEVPLHFILDKEDVNATMAFEKEAYDLRLPTPLLEKEIALIKMTSVVPSWARFSLTGPLSEHFSAFAEGGVVVVSSIPCTDCLIDIPSQFSLLLTYSGTQTQSTLLNFAVENIQRLRFDYSYEADVEEGAHTFKKVVKLKATGGKATYSLDDPSGLFSVHPKTGMLTVQLWKICVPYACAFSLVAPVFFTFVSFAPTMIVMLGLGEMSIVYFSFFPSIRQSLLNTVVTFFVVLITFSTTLMTLFALCHRSRRVKTTEKALAFVGIIMTISLVLKGIVVMLLYFIPYDIPTYTHFYDYLLIIRFYTDDLSFIAGPWALLLLCSEHPEFVFIDTVGPTLTLTATATAGEQKARTTVAIRILPKSSLNGFYFEQEEYKFTIQAGQREAGQVSLASNQTTGITYRLAEGPQELFDVSNGAISYTGKFPKEDQRFLLLVLAESKEQSAAAVTKADVTVTGIASNVLELVSPKNSTATVSAEKSKGVVLHTVEISDKDDNSNIEFSVLRLIARNYDGEETELPKDFLEVTKNGKQAKLAFKDDIGEAEWLSMEAEIEARDVTHPLEPAVTSNLEVFITRDEPLKKKKIPLAFVKPPTSIMIPSSLKEDSFVYQFRVNSASADVVFTMESSPVFKINTTSGVVSTKRKLTGGTMDVLKVSAKSEDGEAAEKLTVEVASPSEVTPQAEKHISVKIPVTKDVGANVANITVQNNVEASFDLEGSEYFVIDKKGMISIASELPKNVANYELLARATNEHGASDCQINILVDLDAGKSLKFSQETYFITIMQNILVNSYVTDLRVAEHGDLPVKYSITAPEGEEQLLDIDDQGKVTVREEFDAVRGPRTFKVTANDGKRWATTSLMVNVKPAFNCLPQFVKGENDLFYVNENEAPDTKIGKVSAVPLDPKCEPKFFFWEGEMTTEETDFARIDTETGEISAKMTFDYENTSSYSMVLGIRAGERQTAQHASLLLVKDVDDHPIEFERKSITVEVSEASSSGSLITSVRARDGDVSQKLFYSLRDSDDGEEFLVEPETGKIRLVKPLDREREDNYTIEIGASNKRNASEEEIQEWSSVRIVVKDVNDNGPVFDRGHYEALLEKTSLPGRQVAKVHAVDPDISENGAAPVVFYSLEETLFEYRGTSRPMSGFFQVDQKTGVVQLLEPVSDFVGGVFHLLIQGADGLEPTARKGKTGLRVLVHEDSDVVRAEIARNPEFVEIEDVQNLTQSIANATGLRVLVKEIGYHLSEGVVLRDVTDIKMILFNKTNFEIASADKAMAMMKTTLRRKGPAPRIEKAQLPVTIQDVPIWPSPVLIVVFVFILLFVLATLLFSMLICHYRARYHREKQNFEDHRIIRDALEGPRPRLPPPHPLPRIVQPQNKRSEEDQEEEDGRHGYGSQVRKISVGPDEPPRRNF